MGKFKRCSILEHGNTGYSDSSKPADKAIEEYEKFILSQKQKVSIVANMIHIAKHSSDVYIDKIKKENATLKKSLSLAGELIEELKRENKLQKAQLRRFGQVFDNCGGKEVDAEEQGFVPITDPFPKKEWHLLEDSIEQLGDLAYRVVKDSRGLVLYRLASEVEKLYEGE